MPCPNSTAFTPFVGAGVGAYYAHHDVTFSPVAGGTSVESDHSSWVFGYQLMAGVAWEITSQVYLDLTYRFVGLEPRNHQQDNVPIKDVDMDSSQIHTVLLGVRFPF